MKKKTNVEKHGPEPIQAADPNHLHAEVIDSIATVQAVKRRKTKKRQIAGSIPEPQNLTNYGKTK